MEISNSSWREMASTWKTPTWIQDAKFGLWAHWGPQSVPRLGGGWYARHIYMPDVGRHLWGRNAYRYHCETYGHPSEYGYKDLIHDHFKAERFDAGALVSQFKAWGARYVAIIANHHDNFDMYPTTLKTGKGNAMSDKQTKGGDRLVHDMPEHNGGRRHQSAWFTSRAQKIEAAALCMRVRLSGMLVFALSSGVLLGDRAQGGGVDVVDSNPDGGWSELAAQWTTPEWIQDAKFGIWAHWGPQSVPRLGGGWYARHMYMPDVGKEKWGRNAYRHHVETYGHPSEYGYKDVIHDHFKAEQFNADALVRQFKDWGARYVAIVANHHDNFDLYPTTVHDWNSMKVGPKRDLVGEFAEAARKHELPWAATVHAGRTFFPGAGTADQEGPKAGVPYDLALTKADGKGQWWEGLDPRHLYGQPKHFGQRTLELVQNYRPDMLYFDRSFLPWADRWVLAAYYRESLDRNGSIEAIISVKKPASGAMLDVERGQLDAVQDFVWQTDTTMFNGWFRKEDEGEKNLRYDTRCLVEMLTDIVSKNGVLLLNVALYGDGSIPADQALELQGLADWLKVHGEAVYGTRPWVIHGVGGQTRKGHFSERTRYDSKPWGPDVLRFTRSKDGRTLYIFVYNPQPGEQVVIAPLAQKHGYFTGRIAGVSLLGVDDKVNYSVNDDGLHILIPATVRSSHASVIRVDTDGL